MTADTCAKRIGHRVVVETHGGLIYGAAGRLTLQSVDQAGGLILALPKGAPCARIPAKSVKCIRTITTEES